MEMISRHGLLLCDSKFCVIWQNPGDLKTHKPGTDLCFLYVTGEFVEDIISTYSKRTSLLDEL